MARNASNSDLNSFPQLRTHSILPTVKCNSALVANVEKIESPTMTSQCLSLPIQFYLPRFGRNFNVKLCHAPNATLTVGGLGITSGAIRHLDPTHSYPTSIHTHRRPILHRLGTVHFCPRQMVRPANDKGRSAILAFRLIKQKVCQLVKKIGETPKRSIIKSNENN